MKDDKRFEIVEKEGVGLTREAVILRDKNTGINYLFFTSGYGGGLTPLLDSEGKPIVDRVN